MNAFHMQKINKVVIGLLSGLLVLTLTGCWDRREINDVAIILSTGIDYVSEKEVELSVEIVIPEMMTASIKNGGGGPGARSTFVESAKGVTLAAARSKLQEKIARNLFWGHGHATVIGEKLAKEGISEHLDFFARLPDARLRNNVFVCKGKAKDLISSLPHLENSASDTLTELSKFQINLDITMSELLQMFADETSGAALPMVKSIHSKKEKGKMEDKTQLLLNGAAIFKGDKMVGTLDDSVTRGLLWVRDEIKFATITIEDDKGEGKITSQMIRSYTKLIPKIQNGRWKMTIYCKTEDDVIQNSSRLELKKPAVIRRLEQKVEKRIEGRIKKAVEQVQKKMKVDVLTFNRSFERKYPKEWKGAKDRWEEIFPEIEIDYKIEAKILRPGLSSESPAIPEDKVRKE